MNLPPPLAGAVRGLVASMAMSGMRQVTTGLGLLEETPPEDILSDQVPGVLLALSEGHEQAAVELAHWSYGTAVGGLFGLLPARLRRSRAAGPTYGIATWLVFELVIAPALGLRLAERRTLSSRAMLIGDHLLYGIVVAGQLPREPREEIAADAEDDTESEPGATLG